MAGQSNVVCANVQITGACVELGMGNVFQPLVRIIQADGAGAIIIGNNNIFEEQVTIFNSANEMHIGDNNLFNSGCVPSSHERLTLREALLGDESQVGDGCIIGPRCTIAARRRVPANSIIFGQEHTARAQSPATPAAQAVHIKHVEYLREVLPKYHTST
nr:Dynactin subunit 6 [Polyrhizophydium stewartii]